MNTTPGLSWHLSESARTCRIMLTVSGGYVSPREDWPRLHEEMVTKMIALHAVLQPYVEDLPSE